MWTSEDFPGADHVPWQFLIRARYQFELDSAIASMVVRAAERVAPRALALDIAKAAFEGSRFGGRDEAPAEQRIAVLSMVADWDGELCPRWWPWPWPGPRRDDLLDIGDPLTTIVLERALALVEAGGSEQLAKTLGAALRGGSERLAA